MIYILIILISIIACKKTYQKGYEKGKDQILEENLIRAKY